MEIILSVEFYAISGLHLDSHPSLNVSSDRIRIPSIFITTVTV